MKANIKQKERSQVKHLKELEEKEKKKNKDWSRNK